MVAGGCCRVQTCLGKHWCLHSGILPPQGPLTPSGFPWHILTICDIFNQLLTFHLTSFYHLPLNPSDPPVPQVTPLPSPTKGVPPSPFFAHLSQPAREQRYWTGVMPMKTLKQPKILNTLKIFLGKSERIWSLVSFQKSIVRIIHLYCSLLSNSNVLFFPLLSGVWKIN